jgi:hypothetical protein
MSFLIGKPNQRFTTNKSFLLLGGAVKKLTKANEIRMAIPHDCSL